MKPAPFRLFRPDSIDSALELLAVHRNDAKIIAGGQSLVPMMNLRMVSPDVLIDIGLIKELCFIREEGDCVGIGAATRQSALVAAAHLSGLVPLLHRAAHHVGHVQTRARGTLGGSLAHADPAAELCLAVALLDAGLLLRSVRGEREVRAGDFFQSALTTSLEPDEILCEVRISKTPPLARVSFRELARRHGDFAIAAIAVQLEPSPKGGWLLRAAVGGIQDAPHVFRSVPLLRHDALGRAVAFSAIEKELATLSANTDIHASGGYRVEVSRALLSDCLDEVFS